MAYTKTTWVNNSTPAINATNLNNMETGIDGAHVCGNIAYTPFGDIIATNVQAAITELENEKVAKATFDANTILAANTDDTPAAVAVGVQTIVGRITAGNIKALSVGEAQTLINVEDGSQETSTAHVNTAGAVMETDYSAQSILMAVTNDTPNAVGVGASQVVGRTAAGNVESLTMAQLRTGTMLNIEDGATGDQTGAEIKTLYEAEADAFTDTKNTKLTGIEESADVTDAVNIASSIVGVVDKATPVDADSLGIIDSAAVSVLKELTWANIKATLKTYFDSLYASLGANSDITSLTGLTTPLDETYGGTGTTTYAQGDVIYASGSNTLAKLTKGTATQVLTMNAGATAPEWAAGGGSSSRTRTVFIGVPYAETITSTQNGGVLSAAGHTYLYYACNLPKDYSSITSVKIVYAAATTAGNVVIDLESRAHADGESRGTHYEGDSDNIVAIGDTNVNHYTTSINLTNVGTDDTIVFDLHRNGGHTSDTNTGDLYIHGILITYTADM